MDTKYYYGIIGILILGIGSGLYLSQEQIDYGYTCTTSNITGVFEKFSSTNKTAYWTDGDTGELKQLVCSKGYWIPTKDWARINDVDLNTIEIETKIEPSVFDE